MLYTIKQPPLDFNLLYLENGENLINSIKCYFLNNTTMNLEEGMMHQNSRSIIFQPKNIQDYLIKLKYSENLTIKLFSLEDIAINQSNSVGNNSHIQDNTLITQKDETNQNNVVNSSNMLHNNIYSKNTSNIRKKSALPVQNPQTYSNLMLNNIQSEHHHKNSVLSNRKASNHGKQNQNNIINGNSQTTAMGNVNLNLNLNLINSNITSNNSVNHLSNVNLNNNLNPNISNQNNFINLNNIQNLRENVGSTNMNNSNNFINYNNINQGNNTFNYYTPNNMITYSSNNNHVFDFKISNFCEIFNKIIKDNSNLSSNNMLNNLQTNTNHNQNNNIIFQTLSNKVSSNNNQNNANYSSKNINNLNANNINLNNSKKRISLPISNIGNASNIQNMNNVQNVNNSNLNLINIQNVNNINNNVNIYTFDIQNYFYENNLNYQNFVEFLAHINTNLSRDSKMQEKNLNHTKYIFCIAKCNKTHNITRTPITNYEIILNPKKFFFILEGDEQQISYFLEDNKFVNDILNKAEEDTFIAYNNYIGTKIKTQLQIFENSNNLACNYFSTNKPQQQAQNSRNYHSGTYNKASRKQMQIEKEKSYKLNEIKIKQGLRNNYLNNIGKSKQTSKAHNGFSLTQNQKDQNFDNDLNLHSMSFDKTSKLHDSSSEVFNIIKTYIVNRILPEGIQRGILAIYSNGIVEFKPVVNNYKNKSLQIILSKINIIVKYRYLYRYKAINIFLYQSQRSKLFDFDNESEFIDFYEYLYTNCKNLEVNYEDVEHHTNLWKFGSITNFEYLIYLNTVSSRSFSDLSQYPIFPWILSNYEDKSDEIDLTDSKNFRDLAKPIGALTPYKFERFLQNFNTLKKNSLNDPPFIYSDFYSVPAHVIYYLVRAHPLFQMKYKNGSLGPPDRLFNSVKDSWTYLTNINNDVKELIPEFYSGNGDYLVNVLNLNLGETAAGKSIDEVVLPRWAKSPAQFINVCKSALESKYVSMNINKWIDLIFGYKQKNENAIAGNNLFYYMTYEDSLATVCDKDFNFENQLKKQAFITQLMEYGQVPRLLFDKPHPVKKVYNLLSLDQFIIENSHEELLQKIEYLFKENKKLEEDCVKLEREKTQEKENLIKNYDEIENKRKEKIKILKSKLNDREKEYRQAIDKMIQHNNQMKSQFENYDEVKNHFYGDIIGDLEKNNEKDINSKFLNSNEVFQYIKNLETSINKFKIKESQLNEELNLLNLNYKKSEDNQSKIKEKIENIKKKIQKIPH